MSFRYELDIYELIRSTSRRSDLTIMVMDREDGQSSKFKKTRIAFLVQEDGSITLLSNVPIKVQNFGTPDSD